MAAYGISRQYVPVESRRYNLRRTFPFACKMRFPTAILALLPLVVHAFPNAPLKTSNQLILDSTGANFTNVGVNWPGAGEVMIPEGLQYQSISSIVSKIKSLGMNVIRLTYAIEMVDDIYAGGDVSLENALVIALGSENGTVVLDEILTANPSFSANTTRLEVSMSFVIQSACLSSLI